MNLHQLLTDIAQALHPNFGMGLDLLLATIPCVLSFIVFRYWTRHTEAWWFAVIVFILFLPNAAYTLTDLMHLAFIMQSTLATWQIDFVVIPEFALYIAYGSQAHVISLMNVVYHLEQLGQKKWCVPVELTLNLLCAVGIYFGRVQRLNSWYVVTEPERLLYSAIGDLSNKSTLLVMLAIFLVVTAVYYTLKTLNRLVLRVTNRFRRPRSAEDWQG